MLAFGSAMGQKAWQVTIAARNVIALAEAIGKARGRLGLTEACPVFSCYEAGREGFWLHRLLTQLGIENLVVDSCAIDVNRRPRLRKIGGVGLARKLTIAPQAFVIRWPEADEHLSLIAGAPAPGAIARAG